jgi:hypothetical protein
MELCTVIPLGLSRIFKKIVGPESLNPNLSNITFFPLEQILNNEAHGEEGCKTTRTAPY